MQRQFGLNTRTCPCHAICSMDVLDCWFSGIPVSHVFAARISVTFDLRSAKIWCMRVAIRFPKATRRELAKKPSITLLFPIFVDVYGGPSLISSGVAKRGRRGDDSVG